MVEAVEKFYYLPIKLKSQMGKRSREIAENLFQKEKFINSYIELIER